MLKDQLIPCNDWLFWRKAVARYEREMLVPICQDRPKIAVTAFARGGRRRRRQSSRNVATQSW